ncbi:hypothetical protein HanRHA438_Chr16g0789131 [Helianthus annuus]|nr:hypothetical protein HanRHA438_Chr16g0789131 [Helianthus annuus]
MIRAHKELRTFSQLPPHTPDERDSKQRKRSIGKSSGADTRLKGKL